MFRTAFFILASLFFSTHAWAAEYSIAIGDINELLEEALDNNDGTYQSQVNALIAEKVKKQLEIANFSITSDGLDYSDTPIDQRPSKKCSNHTYEYFTHKVHIDSDGKLILTLPDNPFQEDLYITFGADPDNAIFCII